MNLGFSGPMAEREEVVEKDRSGIGSLDLLHRSREPIELCESAGGMVGGIGVRSIGPREESCR